ncbi:MAG TPA: protein translocase subunit SecDF [Bacteroidales bacterium]|nr:protein translocase subunit SecDF [Bacteroidales bacterium]
MRNKGAIWTLAIALALVCIYQLSFTLVTYLVKKDAQAYARDENNVVDLKKADYYLDSIASEPVYNFLWLKKYTYRECQEREINLGLDLQGGMNVVLEVSVVDVIRSMANYSRDTTFNKALELARRNQVGSNENFVTLFGQAFEQIDPNARLSALFTSPEFRERINYNTPNNDVLSIIREEADKAISNSFNIITTRIDHFGVTSPNVQRLQSGDRILVELPGVSEKDRVRKLLQGAARLEFWETYDNTDAEIRNGLMSLNEIVREINRSSSPVAAGAAVSSAQPEKQAAPDTTEGEGEPSLLEQITGDTNAAAGDTSADATAEAFFRENPLFSVLIPYVYQNNELIPGSVFGQVHIKDTARVNQYLKLGMQRGLFPRDFRFLWSAKPIENNNTKESTDYYEVHAIKVTSRDNRAPLTGDVVTRAVNEYDQNTAEAFVSMDMNSEGTQIWARLTRENVGKIIAVVMDDYVYSYPRVNEEIPNGSSRISGNFTPEEAEDLANLLKSGTMPAPCSIIQEEVIGPSLGKESIKSGISSLLISFVLIFAFMIFYYTRRAGLIADIALFLNMFFLFGVLASLGLVLTLPGIAGIVLTIGMSVDANVLIYERIREELAAGKGVRMAVADGYKNALSAIVDGNLTTLITGIILFMLGTGPVKGFATTLVVGIITSLFAAIYISRLVFEIMLDKGNKLTFSTKLSTGAFKNINLDYIKNRKIFYVISSVMIVIGIISLFTNGLDQGVDFAGGRNYIIQFEKPVSNVEVADMVEGQLGTRPTVITYGSEDKVRITTKYGIDSEDPEIESRIEQMIYTGVKPLLSENVTYEQFREENVQGLQKVGPTIAADIKRDSFIALGVALIFMFLYIGFRFRNWNFGLGAIASLAHDAFFVIAMFSLLYGLMPFSMEMDQTFIAAILTIIGYSVNDTVVIFDRIREYKALHPKMDYAVLMNKAINDTFSRTIVTSLTVLITVAIIFFYTGESVQGFAFALLLGLFSGVYSTVFIATALVYETRKNKEVKASVNK